MWYVTAAGLVAIVTMLAGCGKPPPAPKPPEATVTVKAEGAIDPQVTMRADKTEVGPGESVTWTVTVTVPPEEAGRAEQVSVVFSAGEGLVVRGASGPDFFVNVTRSYVLGPWPSTTQRLDSTFTHRLRKKSTAVEVVIESPAEVRVYVGDLDPGQSVTCEVVTEWPS